MEFWYIIGIGVLIYSIIYFRAMNKINNFLSKQENFNPSHEYISNCNKMAIAIDAKSNKIALCDSEKHKLINFDELISVDTKINDETLHQTKRGSQIAGAAVGGILLGPVGLLLGGLTGKKTAVQTIKKISIRVTISNIEKPFYDIVFYEGNPIKIDSSAHKIHSKKADEWVGKLSVILASK